MSDKTFSVQQAIREAARCLGCVDAPCSGACPACVDVMRFIRKIRDRDFLGAARIIRSGNPMGAVCARICPTEQQCVSACQVTGLERAIDIGALQQFAAEYGLNAPLETRVREANGKKVAVVGAGTAGLTAAAYLARLGYRVDVLEKERLPGGILTYGIPDFRLPKDLVRKEIASIADLGVEITTGTALGPSMTLDNLFSDGYDAVFLGLGSYGPRALGAEGEELTGVYQAKDFLRVALAGGNGEACEPLNVGKEVLVFGGGNTALDAASVAIRNGAEHVTVVYRRGFNEMPAWEKDVRVAREDKVDFLTLTSPVKFVGEDGKLTGVECVNMKLGRPDESGRRRPEPIAGSEHVLECDTAIVAIGQAPEPEIAAFLQGVELDDKGLIKVDDIGMTTRQGVFAGGDAVNGGVTAAKAVGEAKLAAAGIHAYLGSPGGELTGCGFPPLESPIDDVDISVEFCGIRFPNPFVLSSAPPTTDGEMIMRAFEAGWGGAVTKTIGPDKIPIENVTPRLASLDYQDKKPLSLVNIELISQYPVQKWLDEIAEMKRRYPKHIVIASIMAEVIKEDWQQLARQVIEAGSDAIELNLSCPHGMPERGMGSALGQDPDLVRQITGWVKEVSTVPVLVKLTPNITDIRVPARAALEAGADAITAINTVAGLMCVDIDKQAPNPNVGGAGTYGGYSGAGVKPIGLRAVAEIARETGLPISGMGGIRTWEHAIEYLLVGSTTLQVCTAVMFDGYGIVEDLCHGLRSYMYQRGIGSLHELVGKALPKLTSHENLPRDRKLVSSINADLCLRDGKCAVVCADGGYGAITIGEDRLPVVDTEKCDGCSLCMHVCPSWGCITLIERSEVN